MYDEHVLKWYKDMVVVSEVLALDAKNDTMYDYYTKEMINYKNKVDEIEREIKKEFED